MRIAKWTAIVVGGTLLLLVAAVFVITSVIDPNRYRGKIEAIVADLAGRPFFIEGNLDITWYPWLGVRMGAARLDNDRAGPPLAEWQSMTVAAKLLPLLKGQVVVDRIRLQSPHIRLRRDAQGRGNWEGLGPHSSAPASGGQKTSPQIAGVEISDGTLEYVDEMTGLKINLSGLELDMGEWREGQALPIHTRFVFHKDSLPPSGVPVEVDAPDLNIRLKPLNVAAPKLTVRVADARITGDLSCDSLADGGIATHGTIALQVPSLRKLAHDLALDQTLPHDPTALGPLELTSRWSYVAGALSAKPLAVKLDGVNFNGWVERTPAPASAWSFELHGDRIDLGRYFNVDSTNKKPFELPVDTLRSINANGSLIFDQAQYADTRMSNVRLTFQTPEVPQ